MLKKYRYPQSASSQQVKTDPAVKKAQEDELDRKHPSTRINHLACLVALLSFAYGITMTAYSCGARYITLTVFGAIMFILCLVSFYRKYVTKHRLVFYGISAFFIFMTGITSFIFISQVNQQMYCGSQWCHTQVETRDFFSDYLDSKYSSSQLSQKCSTIDSQYSGTMEHEQVGQFLVSEMIIYCTNSPSACTSTNNMYQHIYWHNISLTRGLLIAMGILEVVYALWLIWWLKFRNPRDDIYEAENNGYPQHIQQIDANGSMIFHQPSTIQQQQALNNSIHNQSLVEYKVQQKLNEYQYNNGSMNQSIVNSTRNMVKPQDNGLIYVGNNGAQSNLKQSYVKPQQQYYSSIAPGNQVKNISNPSNDLQIVRQATIKQNNAPNPLKNINQQNQMSRVNDQQSPTKLQQQQQSQFIQQQTPSRLQHQQSLYSQEQSPKKLQSQQSILLTQQQSPSKMQQQPLIVQQQQQSPSRMNQPQSYQPGQLSKLQLQPLNPNPASNLQRSVTNANGRTHALSSLVGGNGGGNSVLNSGQNGVSLIRKANQLQPYT